MMIIIIIIIIDIPQGLTIRETNFVQYKIEEHYNLYYVTLYPKFVRQWGVSGCQRSSKWVLFVMNSRRMGW